MAVEKEPFPPDGGLANEIRALLAAPKDEMRRLFTWLAAPENPLPSSGRDLRRLAEALELPKDFALEHAYVIRFLVTNWRRNRSTLDDFIESLSAVGIEEESRPYARELFALLEDSKERFFVASLRGLAEITGLPTVDTVRALWDIRPVFDEITPQSDDVKAVSEEQWLTSVYALILEVVYSGRNGSEQVVTLQMNEGDLERLEETLSRARKQLQAIKKRPI